MPGRRTIAVIGGGVSGLTAAHVLQRTCDVTLYEADERLGGHAHTHDVAASARLLAVDSGFIVHNDQTYPQLRRLFRELGVSTRDTEMSLSVSCAGCGLGYAGALGLSGLFATPRSLVRGRYLRMLSEIPRFHRAARALLDDPDDQRTLDEFLRGRFSSYFRAHFMTPLVAAVWSCAPQTAGLYPARYLFTFLEHHGMLSVQGSHQWKTVSGGSRTYVERVAKALTAVHTSAPVRAVSRVAAGVEVRDESGRARVFDGAVIATHPDQALKMRAEPSRAENELLGALVDGYVDFCIEHPEVPALWMHRWLSDAADVAHLEEQYVRPLMELVTEAVRKVVTDDVDVEFVVWTVVWCTHGFGCGGILDADGNRGGLEDSRAVARFRAHMRRTVAAAIRLPAGSAG